MKYHRWLVAGLVIACAPTSTQIHKSDTSRSATKPTRSLLPEGSAIVGGLSLAKLRETALWASLPKTVVGGRLKEVCGIDKKTAVDSIVLAVPTDQNPKHIVMITNGNVSEVRAIDCARELAEKDGLQIRVEKTRNVVSFLIGKMPEKVAHVSWLSDRSVLITGGDRPFLESTLSGKTSIDDNAKMVAMMKRVDTGATFWAVVDLAVGPGAIIAAAMPLVKRPTAGRLSIDYGHTLTLTMGLVFENEDAASAAAVSLSEKIDNEVANGMYGKYLAGAKCSASGTEAIISLHLGPERLGPLTEIVKSLLPTLLGKI